ncbi:MAG: aminotransferase class V-fold PLP-dependent enzyme [Oscillospiraceae bacterium]
MVFTMNATHALNIAIFSLVKRGDRVVVSGWEHNAVTRPLHLIGADIDVAASPLFNTEAAVAAFREKIPGAKAVVCTHVSNVFGFVLPIYEIAALCREEGVPLIVDASQSAGLMEVDMARLGAEFICVPGHKGLLGPQGTGVLLCRENGRPLMAGGTGSESRNQAMPEFLPDRLEAGTHNIPGIAGLMAGAEYVRSHGAANIGAHERALMRRMARQLENVPGLEVFEAADDAAQAGVLSVRHGRIGSEELGAELGRRGVCVRAGLHGAPLAHETAGTLETGTVRLSFSPFNTPREIDAAAQQLKAAVKSLSDA